MILGDDDTRFQLPRPDPGETLPGTVTTIVGDPEGAGHGPTYQLRVGNLKLPQQQALEYVHKLTTTTLLLLAVLLFIGVGIFKPARAARLLVAGAKRQVGV